MSALRPKVEVARRRWHFRYVPLAAVAVPQHHNMVDLEKGVNLYKRALAIWMSLKRPNAVVPLKRVGVGLVQIRKVLEWVLGCLRTEYYMAVLWKNISLN